MFDIPLPSAHSAIYPQARRLDCQRNFACLRELVKRKHTRADHACVSDSNVGGRQMRRRKDCEEGNSVVIQHSPRFGSAIDIPKQYAVKRCIVEGNARRWADVSATSQRKPSEDPR